MYAVVKTGGKQYRVAKDDTLVVEKLTGEVGEVVQLGDVLMLAEEGKAPTVGAPTVDKAAVFAEVVEQGKGDKVIIFKKQRRQNHRRKNGHRQELTTVKVVEISPTGTKPKAAAAEKKAPAKKTATKKAAAKKKTEAAEAPAAEKTEE